MDATYDVIVDEAKEETVAKKEQPEKVFGVTSLVFGILSLVSFIIPLPLSAYFPLIGVIFSVIDKAKNKKMTGVGKGGLVCSIIAYTITVITILTTLLLIVLIYAALIGFAVYMALEAPYYYY